MIHYKILCFRIEYLVFYVIIGLYTEEIMTKENNKVLVQAWSDYNPGIVSINEEVLVRLNISDEQKNILAHNEIDALKDKNIKESTRFLIALNSINYQFWDIENDQFVRYQNKGKVGALGSFEGFVSLYTYLEENNFDTRLINTQSIEEHFGNIPDKSRRILILQEAFDSNKFEQVFNTIESHIKTDKVDVNLAEKIAQILPVSYEDPYLKKIQLALYEIAQIYVDKGTHLECDITVAADYQIPKVLEGMGVLQYSAELSQKIDNLELIEENSKEEKALRAATIIACENISQTHNISIPALDRLLWLARNEFKNKNFHLTRTSNY